MRNRASLRPRAICLVAQQLAQKGSIALLAGCAHSPQLFFQEVRNQFLMAELKRVAFASCTIEFESQAADYAMIVFEQIVSRLDLRYKILLVALIASCASAHAQETGLPSQGGMELGGAGGFKAPTPLSIPSGENAGIERHLGPTGQACLAVRGEARAETINPKLFEHVIVATNDCSQRIKADVCYYLSDHCVSLDVPSYGRDEKILGIMPSMTGFRFEYREQFSGL
jgi:hypothetical protein